MIAACGAFTTKRLAVLALALGATVCSAHGLGGNWKADCVGRTQLSLPDDVDMAATSPRDLAKYSDPPTLSFIDGQAAPWSAIFYLGSIEIVHGLSSAETDKLVADRKAARTKIQANSAKRTLSGNKPAPFRHLPVEPQVGFGFEAQGQKYLNLRLGEHIFLWSGNSGISAQVSDLRYSTILAGLRSRDLFSVPRDAGVCLPYAFVHDGGDVPRDIATTYRLRKHPDVTIMLRDRSAIARDSSDGSNTHDPEYESNEFWTSHRADERKSLRSVWSTPYRSTRLASATGVESFVKIVRNDDSVDYGYLVVARGDANEKSDGSDLMLYVIQDSVNATKRGVAPMRKDEFLEMAQAIAGSVKARSAAR